MFRDCLIRPVLGSLILTRKPIQLALLVGALLAAAAAGVSHASDLDFQAHSAGEILLAQRAIADSVPEQPTPVPGTEGSEARANEETESYRSPGRAFLLNLLVPGAGHLYAGNKRGWIHLGLEGATWVTWLYYHDRGKSKEDQYEAYADANWDYQRWKSDAQIAGTWTQEADDLILGFSQNNRQQYYEDIGKLPIYWIGWQGYDATAKDAQPRRFYRGIRNDSNNFLKNARYAVVGGFVNRIVSAVDVLRILKNRGHAKLGADTSIKFNMKSRPFSSENAIRITVSRRLY